MERIDHIAVVVNDLDRALASYEAMAGLTAELREDNEAEGLRSAFLTMGQLVIELIEPRKEGPLARFLESSGQGLHHIAYRVRDMEIVLARLSERGVKLLDQEARHDVDGISIFLDPADTGGVLTELIQR
jgi:methylmalonyl-CoA epimerase